MFRAIAFGWALALVIPAFAIDPDQVIKGFEQPSSDYSSGHRGVDIYLAPRKPLLSPLEATISFSGKVVNRHVLSLKNGQHTISFEPICSDLSAGDIVSQGQILGFLCDGQNSYQPHCDQCYHLSIRQNGSYVDPLVALSSFQRSRLLPSGSGVSILITTLQSFD